MTAKDKLYQDPQGRSLSPGPGSTTLQGKGYTGSRSTTDVEQYHLYHVMLRTIEPTVIRKAVTHDWLQFHFQLSGSTTTVKDHRSFEIHPNTFSIHFQQAGGCAIHLPGVCSYQSFGFLMHPDDFLRSDFVRFPEFNPLIDAIKASDDYYYTSRTPLSVAVRRGITELLTHPYRGTLEVLYTEHKLIDLMFNVLPFLHQPPGRPSGREKQRQQVQRAECFIVEHLGEKLSIKKIAREVGLNEFTLKKEFKRAFGFSVMDYCLHLRLHEAYDRIVKSDETITVIASELGYSEVSNFSNAFQKRFGIRPRTLRSKAK